MWTPTEDEKIGVGESEPGCRSWSQGGCGGEWGRGLFLSADEVRMDRGDHLWVKGQDTVNSRDVLVLLLY